MHDLVPTAPFAVATDTIFDVYVFDVYASRYYRPVAPFDQFIVYEGEDPQTMAVGYYGQISEVLIPIDPTRHQLVLVPTELPVEPVVSPDGKPSIIQSLKLLRNPTWHLRERWAAVA